MNKRCSKCGNEYPATTEFFGKCKTAKSGLFSYCRECNKKRQREYFHSEEGYKKRRESIDKNLAANKERNSQLNPHADASKTKICGGCNRSLSVLEFSIERIRGDGLHGFCKSCANERQAKYRADNLEKARETSNRNVKRWRENNPEKAAVLSKESSARYKEKNLEKVQERNRRNVKRWLKENPEYRAIANTRRRARKKSLPNDFTLEDWQYALDYFNGCCAICGRQAKDLFGERTIAADHFIPMSKGGGTVPENIIPLCHGIDGCNSKKHAKDPAQWLHETYGKRKANEIIAKIETFFSTVRQTRQDKSA